MVATTTATANLHGNKRGYFTLVQKDRLHFTIIDAALYDLPFGIYSVKTFSANEKMENELCQFRSFGNKVTHVASSSKMNVENLLHHYIMIEKKENDGFELCACGVIKSC